MPVDQGAFVKSSSASNRPYHSGSRLGELIEDGPVGTWRSYRLRDVKLGADDYLTALILSACPRDRMKLLQAIYDEVYVDRATEIAFGVIAYSRNLFGKVITKSDEGRAIVCNILRGVRAGMAGKA